MSDSKAVQQIEMDKELGQSGKMSKKKTKQPSELINDGYPDDMIMLDVDPFAPVDGAASVLLGPTPD